MIPDETLEAAILSEREPLVEIACRLFDADKLPLWPAAQLAGLSRTDFEHELRVRKIPIYRPTLEEFRQEMAALDRMGI